MAKIAKNLTELIGNTPLLELNQFSAKLGLETSLIAKFEYFNPSGSVKDRPAYAMIVDAEKKGLLKAGATIIEPTSGNTGIGIAAVAASRGYKAILTMPDTMSIERRALVQAYGAELVLTEGKLGMKGAIAKANELKEEYKNAVILQQFENPANPETHRKTTALEIIEDFGKDLDVFVTGIGTGGSITGTGEVLKANNPNIKIIAV